MSEILISSWWKNPCWQSQRSDVSCSWSLGLHTSLEGLWDTSHSLGRVFGVIVMLEYPSTTHFQCPDPDGTWPRPSSLWCGVVALSPLQIKHPQSIMFPPPCLTVGMVFLGSQAALLLLQTRRVELMPKSSILVWSDHNTLLNYPLNHW